MGGIGGFAPILIVETIAYVISWVAFPLFVLPVARHLGRADRFLSFMVVYNWSQIPQTVLFVLVGLDTATGLLPPSGAHFAGLLAAIAALVYEWYIARGRACGDRHAGDARHHHRSLTVDDGGPYRAIALLKGGRSGPRRG